MFDSLFDKKRLTTDVLTGIGPGLLSGLVLSTTGSIPSGIFSGFLLGLGYASLFHWWKGKLVDHLLGGMAFGAFGWGLVQTLVLPLIMNAHPIWSAGKMVEHLPNLGGWMLAGSIAGGTIPLIGLLWEEMRRKEEVSVNTTGSYANTEQIVILGGGFVGLTVARQLETKFGPDPSVNLTLINRSNSVLFTPMLPEVASGTLEPTHVATPLRRALYRTRVTQGEVRNINTETGTISFQQEPVDRALGTQTKGGSEEPHHNPGNESSTSPEQTTIDYDQLVVGFGSVPNYMGMEGVARFSFDFKTLQDAMTIRNHVINCLEQAELESDPQRQRALLTFVVAGAGFAGAELAGALNDMVRETVVDYPNIPDELIRVMVVHSKDVILPELPESLGRYALERMRERGVQFVLNEYLEGADPEQGIVQTTNIDEINTKTLIWTAGNRPNPMIHEMDLPEADGAIDVDSYLSVPGYTGLWAAGDCAHVTDAETGEPHPATAQHAVRAGKTLAENLFRTVRAKRKNGEANLKPHSYNSLGSLCVIGHQTACAEINGWRFSGLFAWLLWRAIYLKKLPGIERRLNVFFSWLTELFFPRESVQTIGPRTRKVLKDE